MEKKIKKLIGKVVSVSNQTAVVLIERKARHPKYLKQIKKIKKIMVHDVNGLAKISDNVEIVETRPISKKKSWRIGKVI